ncbi:citrate lyase subunit alpha, partial [bacterium]|nr:citrate lyase subunit alpha [bacterium]
GIGGWQNCLFSKCTILPIPAFRDRIPVVVDEVTTLVGPGELVDVVITERGIAINPLREDLLAAVHGKGLPIRTIREMKADVDDLVGGAPKPAEFEEKVVAAIKWVDGTVIDSVRQVKG